MIEGTYTVEVNEKVNEDSFNDVIGSFKTQVANQLAEEITTSIDRDLLAAVKMSYMEHDELMVYLLRNPDHRHIYFGGVDMVEIDVALKIHEL